MKHFKRLASVLLAMVMVLAMAIPATAADETGKITIDNAMEGKTYTIYKIFDQENYQAGGQGSYKVAAGWEEFIKNDKTVFETDKDGYVKFVNDNANPSASVMEAFAKNALKYAQENGIAASGSKKAEGTTVTFEGLDMGYYLVDSSAGAICSLDATTPSVTIKEKNEEPTVDKDVKEPSANIGDKVNYTVTITAQAGAQNYVLSDTMSVGLTFDPSSLKVVHVRGEEGEEITVKDALAAGTDYTLTPDTAVKGDGAAETFSVNFGSYSDKLLPGDRLVVTYSATINDEAEVDLSVENKATLKYGENHSTTSDPVETKLFSIPVYKFGDKNGTDTALSGAKFILTRGEYDTVDEAVKNAMSFRDTKENVYFYYSDASQIPAGSEIASEIITPNDGKFIIKGLEAGTYYLWETAAPDGYNRLTAPITVVIADDGKITIGSKTFDPATDITAADAEESMVQVENKSGVNLPSTGGIGTTIFYIVGGVLVVGAAILLVVKRRAR